MAEPARKSPEEEVQPDIRPDVPELRALEGGGESTPRKRDHLRTASGDKGSNQQGAGSSSSSGESSKGLYNPSELRDAEKDRDDSYYNPKGDRGFFGRNKKTRGTGKKPGFVRRNKALFAIVSVLVAGVVSLTSFFFASIFDLPNFMKNIEQAGFQRYQLDLRGRSTEWLQTYMELRFGEIDDPNLAPKDRDNIFFRSNVVKNNAGMVRWYRTLRASSFEQDLFESKGIRFTSIAKKQGNAIVYRTGTISFQNTDQRISFDPGQATFDAMARGDPNAFNGTLSDFAKVDQEFKSDKEARAFIKTTVNENYPDWWKAVKRYHIRQDIQRMIGVRKWTFFEKTRNNLHEKKVSMRNKIITQALPDESATGDFIKCLFGVPDCKASADPANPDANQLPPDGGQKQGDKTDGNTDNPQPLSDDSAEGTLEEASKTAAAGAGDVANKIFSKLVSKAGIFSMLDSLSRFDEAIHKHTASKVVSQAKSAKVAGMFAVFGVAADQLTTGQQSSSEVNDFMNQFQHATHAEGWTQVVDPKNSQNAISADSTKYVEAKDKAQFCSPQHQEEMQAHPKEAENEFQWSCPQNRVGGPNQAQELEDAWNSGPGGVLHPVLNAYHQATGGIFDVFNSITGAITDPIINATLSITGTQDDVQHLAAWGGQKALEFGGGTLDVNDDTPSGQISNYVLQGSSVTAEASTREQGGIPATPASVAETQKQVAEAQRDYGQTSAFNRYLSASNPKSLFSQEFFAITTSGMSDLGKSLLGIFGSAISDPLRALTQPAHAAVPDGYGACRFTFNDIRKCNDMPAVCLNTPALQMTPQKATNADDLGYFKPSELNWDLMTNQDDWYKALYDKVGGDEDKALTVYNCAPFEDAARSSISSRYGDTGENTIQTSSQDTQDGGNGGDSSTVSSDTKQVAQDILSNNNITYQFSAETDVKLAAQGKPGTNGVPIDIRLLQMVDALGKKHKVDVSAYESYGQGHSTGSDHYTGHAVDIASIDGVPAYQNIFKFFSEYQPYAKGAIFLQKQCGGAAPPAGSGVEWLEEDVCSHQHISVGAAGN